MISYPKIQNLFKFDPATKGRTNEFTCEEFRYLQNNLWWCTEKVDGTNVRLIFDDTGQLEIRGRTDKARLHETLIAAIEVLVQAFPVELHGLTLYGEGYGGKIQKGKEYRPDPSFILFDVWSHDAQRFLDWPFVTEVAAACQLQHVPLVGPISLWKAYQLVQEGLPSTLKDGYAEGLVCRPTVPLYTPHGERVIVKVKHRDYFAKELLR